MGVGKYLLLFSSLASFLYVGNGCQMDGVGTWLLTQDEEILDTYRGTFWNRTTSNIDALTGITVGGSVNYALYLDVQWSEGYFTISTSPGYEQYEENETSEFISFTVNFLCTGGSSNSLIFSIRIQDTNNNPPTFRPTDQYEFTITPPLPPGFQITGCVGNDIVVRDIDLTTSSINFTIEDNPYFEISYEGRSSTDPKEFLASLKTKDLIRSLSEDVELTISATDVDATQDPRITTYATIRVRADEEFIFPEELVFAQPFYTASYTNNQVVMDQTISLQQGYDDEVTFSLDGEHSDYFELLPDGNVISIGVSTALSTEILRSGRVILVIRAEREYTSGATTTVIIQLPEVLGLEFEQPLYEGRIVDNVMDSLQLTLSQGYQETFVITLQNDYASYFSTSVQENVVTLTMPAPLNASIINENSFITLQVIASNENSAATAVVTLNVIKDDTITPVFEKAIYTGQYDPDTGLDVEQITLGQGYDQTVSFSLEGVSEHSEYFSISNDGPVISLTSSGIPSEIWAEQQLLLTIAATKPRTVTATTTVSIRLPTARQLAFEASIYIGALQESTLTLGTITLSEGYAEDIHFALAGDYASYFNILPAQNEVTINLSAALPDGVISENNFLTLILTASGLHAIPSSTAILLEIIKQDLTTPAFTENIYTGSYLGENSIEIGNISLAQGYDDSVTFRLDGEHAQYFALTNAANDLSLGLVNNIPPEVIFEEKVLLFNILAEKPMTVGANTAVFITFPQELTDATVMRFSQNTYSGSLEDGNLALENIVLETGYDVSTEFSLSGEYATYFQLQNTDNIVSISIQNLLPNEILENNKLVILEVEASRERAVSVSASIVIDIVTDDVSPVVFSNAYYKSVYADGNLENLTITLSEGFDNTVTFELQGDNSAWFLITNVENFVQVYLNPTIEIPDEVLENNDYFLFSIVANKLNTVSARTAIFIHLPKETPETVLVRFSQTSYVGRIDNGELYAPVITLLGEREPIYFNITGDYAEYFDITQISASNVEIQLKDSSLPENIAELLFIIIDIEAQYPEAISGHTSIIFEVVKQPEIVTPLFEQAYYIGEYSEQGGLQFDQSIRLSQGFDESVLFTLSGDDAEWFELNNVAENSLTLILSNNSLAQIRDRNYLVFSVVANKANVVAGYAAIIINLSDDTPTASLRFAQDFYIGTIENNILNINSINIAEAYSSDVNITFTGDHIEYFQLTNQDGIITLQLVSDLPLNIISDNNVLVFTLGAQIEDVRTHTTIVLELIKTELTPLAFEETYYVGSYSIIDGFIFDPQITLSEGYDENVLFSLEGDSSQYFVPVIESENSVTLNLISAIPPAVVMNSHHLIFTIRADKPESSTDKATVVIALLDDFTENMELLGFDRTTYIGSLENNSLSLDQIVLREGYSEAVSFRLLGELGIYFNLVSDGAIITITLSNAIPEQLVSDNRIIILELEATATGAISAHAAIIIEVHQDDLNSVLEQLVFSELYYTGQYTESDGLTFEDTITLTEGYDENVVFVLEGDSSQYFGVVTTNNSVSLSLTTPIPSAVVMNNHHLLFTIRADKPDSLTGRATIVIALSDDFTENMELLGFDRTTYIGSLENNSLSLDQIVLREGYSEAVSFRLLGELGIYFNLVSDGAIITITLSNAIPEQLVSDNRIIILELEATATGAIAAHAAIIIEVHQDDLNSVLEQLVFSELYYTGQYTESDGLTFEDTITLTEGYDENVVFVLEGDSSQYFGMVTTNNSVSLSLTTPIPSAVVINNHHLLFTIRADKPDSLTGRATIVIALSDDFTENMELLGFDRTTYIGSLENNSLSLDQIVLREGYSEAVSFRLLGELGIYFNLVSDGAIITITLSNAIPEQLVSDNRIIILELEATATGAISAHAAIIIEVHQGDLNSVLEQLVFSELYYTGQYTESDGLTFEDTITLTEGYDENVVFVLEGDSSQYFGVVTTNNSVSLSLTTPIPSAVVMNNHHLLFTIRADKPDSLTGRATIVIALSDDFTENMELLGFDRTTYIGSLENNSLSLDQIVLREGYSEAVSFRLLGELGIYFNLVSDGAIITITLSNAIPEQLVSDNRIIILELEATATGAISAHAAIIIEVHQDDLNSVLEQLVFSELYYTGQYTESDGLTFEDTITLTEGYDENVVFVLEGDSSQYFGMVTTNNSVSLSLTTPIPSAVVMNNHHLLFTIRADKPDSLTGRATIVIALSDDFTENMELLGFDRTTYIGSLENNSLSLDQIVLREGYSEAVSFRLLGDLQSHFNLVSDGATVTVTLMNAIPEQSVPENRIITLELEASAIGALSSHAVIIIEVIQDDLTLVLEQLAFNEAYYTGFYTEVDGLAFTDTIVLEEGFDQTVVFVLEGDDAEFFEVVMVTDNSVSLRLISSIPSAIVVNNRHLIFTINANRSNYSPTRATIVISLIDEYTEITPVLGFNRISYVGVIESDFINLELIVLTEGYSNNVNFTLLGDLQDYFTVTRNEASLSISLLSVIPTELIPSNNFIILEIQASAPDSVSAHATIVLEVVQEDVEEIIFSDLYYTGHYSLEEGLVFNATVNLSHGYDDTVQFFLEGDDAEWFEFEVSQNSVSISLINSIPENVLESQRKLIFVIVAQKPGISTRAAIIISLIHEAACTDAWFGKVLYEGIVQGSEVQHEAISISGYDGTDIQLIGDFAALFSATLSEGVVVVQGSGSGSLSPDVAYVALELSAGSVSAVLLLDVSHTENPEVPSVTFSSTSYSFRADVSQTGLVGLVHATTNNLEAVTYSLEIEDTHLLQRISINNMGELYLWAPTNGGVYSFQVRATTAFSQVSSTAAIHLTVEAIIICGDDDYVLPPLQILDRDEESPYENLVPFNSSAFEDCRYSLSNRWPADQTWLYVDESGLHANAIDREHDSIAFMALSQIQVELILQCDSDNESTRMKRSVNAGLKTNLEHLGPYDYGNGKWILTDSILYNPRRTLVNLIVNDINDNYPIFNGKEDEPIVVGYPVPELEERILPRALAEVQATDADVGENAELVYWSSEDTLAVSPETGLIHVRVIAGLENNAVLTVYATDRNGQGLTGSLDLLVKLVDTSHIAVVTIEDAFLDDEQDILSNLTTAVGYEVKSLRSSIISDTESEESRLRKKREALVSQGASLQIYVYGLIEGEPVNVERLTGDINTSIIETVIIASMVSLEDHLENLVICPLPGRDTALFVSTIVLAVLLFILIVAAAVWFILKWWKNKNYQEFSDENSLASQNEPVTPVNIPKPEQPTPRINIEDLKKSERRLQNMLDAPLEVDIPTQPIPVQQASVKPVESKVNIPDLPLVIQSFDKLKDAHVSDDDDEFGERKKTRRKSVVTFNENVEKIIHVEDSPDDDDAQDYEVYRL